MMRFCGTADRVHRAFNDLLLDFYYSMSSPLLVVMWVIDKLKVVLAASHCCVALREHLHTQSN
eukprot:scaffold281_cov282-Ochromonas_danica.AAC.2